MASSVFLNRCSFRLVKVSWNYLSPDRRLFRLAYVSWHYRYSYIIVYFGTAKISRHRYSSHIVKNLLIIACNSSAIYHAYLSFRTFISSPLRFGEPSGALTSSLSRFGKPNDIFGSSHTYHGSVSRAMPRLEKSQFTD